VRSGPTSDQVEEICVHVHTDQDRRGIEPGRSPHPHAVAARGGERAHRAGAAAHRRVVLEQSKRWTILAPQVSPIHFRLVQEAVRSGGYDLQFLPDTEPYVVDIGLQYVNNDACYQHRSSQEWKV
jgi:hypothetical protein